MPILDSGVPASSSSSSPAGFLVPLNGNLEEDVESSFLRIPIFHGLTCVDCDSIPVTDKRLSRRHLTLKVLDGGSSEIVAEGTNPVMVRPNNERNKLFSGEAWTIRAGDVIELISGQYLFKYAPVINNNIVNTNMEKKVLNEECREDEYLAPVRKRIRKVAEEEAVLVKSEDASISTTSSY